MSKTIRPKFKGFNNLRELRKAKSLRPTELAVRVGVCTGTIYSWELMVNPNRMKHQYLTRLCEVFNCKAVDIFPTLKE